jgi:hypothetical protein
MLKFQAIDRCHYPANKTVRKLTFCLSGLILLEEDALHLGVNSKSISAKDGL